MSGTVKGNLHKACLFFVLKKATFFCSPGDSAGFRPVWAGGKQANWPCIVGDSVAGCTKVGEVGVDRSYAGRCVVATIVCLWV
jgi:hypothetical protein